jgi:hypothetical protein
MTTTHDEGGAERLERLRRERDQARRLLREIRRYVLYDDDAYAKQIDALLGPQPRRSHPEQRSS